MTDLQKYGLRLVRAAADRVAAGILTGHDWPNSDDELARLQASDLLRQCADELALLRGQRMVMMELLAECANVIHNLPDEAETQDEADRLTALKDSIAMARGTIMLNWHDANAAAKLGRASTDKAPAERGE